MVPWPSQGERITLCSLIAYTVLSNHHWLELPEFSYLCGFRKGRAVSCAVFPSPSELDISKYHGHLISPGFVFPLGFLHLPSVFCSARVSSGQIHGKQFSFRKSESSLTCLLVFPQSSSV